MRLEFIESGPALLVENAQRTLVIADIHFGIEFDLATHGWHFRSRSAERLERAVRTAVEAAPDQIVLLGDVKHGVPITSRQEFRELPRIMDALRARAPLHIAPGNHDGGLQRFVEEDEMMPASGAVIDGVGYLHGHTYPSPGLAGRLLVAGHHHPLVFLMDEVGCALQAPAYLLAPLDGQCLGFRSGSGEGYREDRPRSRVLFMPAFNEFSGIDVRRIWKSPFSPLSRCMAGGRAEVFLADGTFLGLLSRIGGEGHDGIRA
jgi:metallophosphoesterase superfamily enzyme